MFDLSSFEITKILIQCKIIKNNNLSSTAGMVLIALSTYYNPKTRIMYPSQQTLADVCNLHRRTVSRAVQELRDNNLIISAFESGNSSKYSFTDHLYNIIFKNNPSNKMRQSSLGDATHKRNSCDTQAYKHENNKVFKKDLFNKKISNETASSPTVERTLVLLHEIENNKKMAVSPLEFDYNDAFNYLQNVPAILENSESVKFLRNKYNIYKNITV